MCKVSTWTSKHSLHSTMYLLNPEAGSGTGGADCAFTFHNVSIKSRIRQHRDRYLNAPFTFHNVSIKSCGLCHCFDCPCAFTFHNVSIKSQYVDAKALPEVTLHSTMYLLNLCFCMIISLNNTLYIPQCIY